MSSIDSRGHPPIEIKRSSDLSCPFSLAKKNTWIEFNKEKKVVSRLKTTPHPDIYIMIIMIQFEE